MVRDLSSLQTQPLYRRAQFRSYRKSAGPVRKLLSTDDQLFKIMKEGNPNLPDFQTKDISSFVEGIHTIRKCVIFLASSIKSEFWFYTTNDSSSSKQNSIRLSNFIWESASASQTTQSFCKKILLFE